jgi:mono/diheme cytochrome c family protein
MRLAEATRSGKFLRADVRKTTEIQAIPRCLSRLLRRLAASKTSGCLLFAALVWGQVARADDAEAWRGRFVREIQPVLVQKCLDCHGENDPSGEFGLNKYTRPEGLIESIDVWERVARRVRNGEMPPADSDPLTDDERAALLDWAANAPRDERCRQLASDESQKWYRGHVMSRRVTRFEYNNMIRDLTGVDFVLTDALPSDGSGGEGFDTTGDSLFTSAIHMERYLAIADKVVGSILPDDDSGLTPELLAARQRVLAPGQGRETDEAAAEAIFAAFAARAFRREVETDERQRWRQLYRGVRARGHDHLAGVRGLLTAVLVSPHFLFVVEVEPEEEGVRRLDGYELATRMALFIWSSLPDDQLRARAEDGSLLAPEVARREVRRMLADPKARALGENFAVQWLDLGSLGTGRRPDAERFPEFDAELAESMRREVVEFVTAVFRSDASLLKLLDSDETYVDDRLAAHYGLTGDFDAAFRPVSLADSPRGGLTTMAAVLTNTSHAHRTSPVLRGGWLLARILGERVPPPPPDVPALEEEGATLAAQSLRERLEQHRTRAECATCHDRIDPLGFGLEHFDAIGRWRADDAGLPIDASGQLPSGEKFDGSEGLKRILLARSDQFLKHLIRQMLGFAMGRPLNRFDQCVIDDTFLALQRQEYRAALLVEEIVVSYPFQHRFIKR